MLSVLQSQRCSSISCVGSLLVVGNGHALYSKALICTFFGPDPQWQLCRPGPGGGSIYGAGTAGVSQGDDIMAEWSDDRIEEPCP